MRARNPWKRKAPRSCGPEGFDFHFCGAKRDRTADLLNAIQALSQLSYDPVLRAANYLFFAPPATTFDALVIFS